MCSAISKNIFEGFFFVLLFLKQYGCWIMWPSLKKINCGPFYPSMTLKNSYGLNVAFYICNCDVKAKATYDVIIIIKILYMSSRTNGENFVSIWQAVAEKNTKVLCRQTDRQTYRQTNKKTSAEHDTCKISKTNLTIKNNLCFNSVTWYANPLQISSQSDENWGF